MIISAIDKLSAPLNTMKGAISGFQVATDKLNAHLGNAQTALDNAFGSPVYQMFDKFKNKSLEAIEAYGDIATAQGQIRSLGIDETGIELITKKAKEFSNTWAGTTTKDFIAASYDIKSAISTLSDGAVGEFTKLAAMTGGATKSTTAEMTSLFATGFGIHRKAFGDYANVAIAGFKKMSAEEQDIEFGKYFSAGISKAVQAFKTSGPQMAASISALGAAATSNKVPFEEQLAILGQLQTTMSGSEAATKYRSFLGSATAAGKKLGLSFTDTDNKLLSTADILKQIKSKYGDTLDAIESQKLKEAFGTEEAVAMIKLMYGEIDTLEKNTKDLGVEMSKGTALTEAMARAMQMGPAESAKLLAQRQENLAAAFGKTISPLNVFKAELLGGLAVGLSGLIEDFPTATGLIGSFGYGLSEAATFAIPLISQLPAFAQGFGMLKTGVLTALPAIWSFTAALLANPITWIVVGIVALIAAIYLLYKNFDTVSAFISESWESIKNAFSSAWDSIKITLSEAWIGIKQAFYSGLDSILGFIKQWGPVVLSAFFPVLGIGILIYQHFDEIVAYFRTFFQMVSEIFMAGVEKVKALLPDWMLGMIGGGAINANNSTTNTTNAIGGENSPLAPNAPAVPVGADAGIQTINSNANSTVTLKIENAPKGSALGGDPMPGGSSVDMGYGMQ